MAYPLVDLAITRTLPFMDYCDPNDSYLPMSNHPTFTFYNPGTYDVTLELTTNGTTYTKTETDVITVTGLSANSLMFGPMVVADQV